MTKECIDYACLFNDVVFYMLHNKITNLKVRPGKSTQECESPPCSDCLICGITIAHCLLINISALGALSLLPPKLRTTLTTHMVCQLRAGNYIFNTVGNPKQTIRVI